MAQLKTNTSIGTTTIAQGGEVTVTLPTNAGTLITSTEVDTKITEKEAFIVAMSIALG